MTQAESHAGWMEQEESFNSVTSLNVWKRILRRANRLLRGLLHVLCDQTKKGRIKLNLISLRRDLYSHYMHIGELIYRLSEGEEHPSPLDEKEIRQHFQSVTRTLRAITRQRRKYDQLRRKPWVGWVMGKRH